MSEVLMGEVKCVPNKSDDPVRCSKLSPGCWLVFHNGTLAEVEPEEPKVFPWYDLAKAYIDDQLESYAGLDYYMCQVMECHHTTIQKHVRRLV